MIPFIAAALVIVVIIAMMALLIKAIEQDSFISWWSAAAFVFASICLGGIMQMKAEEEAKGPCLREKTEMYWNPGTKTMMPATVCVERAEWVKP